MAIDADLARRLRALFGRIPGSAEQRMFGGVCFMVSGRMCCGIAGRDLVVRVGADAREAALRRPHTRPMDFTGRPLRGFVYVGPEGYRSGPALAAWVRRAVRFALTLPLRTRRKRRPRAARHDRAG